MTKLATMTTTATSATRGFEPGFAGFSDEQDGTGAKGRLKRL